MAKNQFYFCLKYQIGKEEENRTKESMTVFEDTSSQITI